MTGKFIIDRAPEIAFTQAGSLLVSYLRCNVARADGYVSGRKWLATNTAETTAPPLLLSLSMCVYQIANVLRHTRTVVLSLF